MKNLLTKRFRKLMLRLALIGFICPMAYASAEYTQSTIYWWVYNDTLYISDSNTVTDWESISLTGSFSSDANFDDDTIPWTDYRDNVLQVKVIWEVAPLSTASRFKNFNSCRLMDLQWLDTSNVTDMSYMFSNCYSLVSLDVSNFDTSKVTDMSYMFYNCSNLQILDVSNFDTSNVTNIRSMFFSDSKLIFLILGHFDIESIDGSGLNGFLCSNAGGVELLLSSDTEEAVINMDESWKSHTCIDEYELSTPPVYTVKHWKQNAGNDEYTLAATDKKVWETGEQTTATAKKYKGFTAQAIEQDTILGDWTTVVNVYYDRNASEDNNHWIDLNIELTIEEWQLSIGTDGDSSVTLTGSMAASLESKTVEKSLEKLFRVEDLKWSSNGYYTTISVSDLTWEVEDGVVSTISWSNIYLMSNNFTKIDWKDNSDVKMNSWFNTYKAINTPVTYISRTWWTAPWILSKYGDTPKLKVEVPANTPAATYHGVITYTLYEWTAPSE